MAVEAEAGTTVLPWKQKLEKRCCNVANKVRDEETCAMDEGGVTGHCADAVDED